MLVVELKLAIFLLLLLLFGFFWLVWSVAQYRALFDDKQRIIWHSFPLGIVLLSSSGRLQFSNKKADHLLQAKEALETTAVYSQLLHKIEQETAVSHFPFSPSPASTLDVWVGPFGAFQLILLRDITEQRQREMEMHLYWNSVSHELRTPLTSILSHLEISLSEDVSTELQRHSLEIVHQQTHRLSNLVRSTLDLGRLKAVVQMPKQKIDIILVAEEAIAELILLAEAKGIELNFHYSPPMPSVLGNPDKLKQLFINLLDNAIKYCQAGDCVTVSLTAVNHTIQCQIIDTGAGIPAEHHLHLTQQFYRVRRDEPGSGLGLAIVDEIVQQHNGRLHITSHTEGKERGTAVTFTLPILLTPTQQ